MEDAKSILPALPWSIWAIQNSLECLDQYLGGEHTNMRARTVHLVEFSVVILDCCNAVFKFYDGFNVGNLDLTITSSIKDEIIFNTYQGFDELNTSGKPKKYLFT